MPSHLDLQVGCWLVQESDRDLKNCERKIKNPATAMSDILGTISEPCKGQCALPDGAAGPTLRNFLPLHGSICMFSFQTWCARIYICFWYCINVQRHLFRM